MAPNVYVANCDVGRGVFAAKSFEPGERILGFRGHGVDHLDPIHLAAEAGNLLQIGSHRYIYPRPRGLFVNHSCNPNSGLRGTVTLVALRRIEPREEIRFDYSTTMDDGRWIMECRCREANCRAFVRDFHDLPVELQIRYIEMNIVPCFIAWQWSHLTPLPINTGNGSGNGSAPETLGPV